MHVHTIPDDDGLRTVASLGTPAFASELPDWLEDASEDGSTAAFDAGHDGGYYRVSPDGGEARLQTAFSLAPDAYEVVELAARLRTSGEPVAASMGFETDGRVLAYDFAHEDSASADRIRAAGDGTSESVDARVVDPEYEHEVVLRWEPAAGTAELLLDGTQAAVGKVGNLDPAVPHRAYWRASGDRGHLRIHTATIRYRERSNPA